MTQDFFFGLIGVLLGVLLLGMVVYGVLRKYSISPGVAYDFHLQGIFDWLRKDVETRKRLIVTLGVLLLSESILFIPVPGIDVAALKNVFNDLGVLSGSGFEVLMGALGKMSMGGLGLLPFFTACILLQVASVFIPPLRRSTFGGGSGRGDLADHTYPLTILLSLIWAYFGSVKMEKVAVLFHHVSILTIHGWSFRLLAMATLTGGVVLLLFLAEVITRYGLGNGVAVIAVAGVLSQLWLAGRDVFFLAQNENLPVHGVPLVVIITVVFVGVMVGIYLLTNSTIPIKLRDPQGKKLTVHFRPSLVGKMPITLAIGMFSIASLPFAHASWFRSLTQNLVVFNVLLGVLTMGFTYLYAPLVFNSRHIAEFVQKYGFSFVETQEMPVARYLGSRCAGLLMISGMFLAGLTIVPDLIRSFLKVPTRVAGFIGGARILVVIGVLSDLVRQLVFLKDKGMSGLTDWCVCYTALDEIEATIKSEYLKSHGIPALVEPLRFTWGMPVRTIVDQYRIWSPTAKGEEARKLLAA